MNRLISKRDPTVFPKTAIGKQECGIIFWQKTGLFRHCNLNGFKSIVSLVVKKYVPTNVLQQDDQTYYLTFNNNEDETVFLSLKPEENGRHSYILGESHTAYTSSEFHLLALDMVEYIAKTIGSKFYVDDATGYIDHHSPELLNEYISEYQRRIGCVSQNIT